MTFPAPSLRSRLGAWGDAPLATDPRRSRSTRLALLAAFALLVMLRLPAAWAHGRFLGEEGTVFFAYAWHRPAGAALFRPFAGYLNLGANAITLLAAKAVRAGLPLEAAPYLTMTLALAVQLIPAALILTSRAPWLARRQALLAGLATLAVAPRTEEVFTNVLHVQFHLALCAALVLAFDVPRSRRGRAGYATLLFAAPLCGPGAIVLAPFFVLRAAVERDRARLVQAAVFSLGAAVQLLLFFTPSPARGQLLDPATLAAILFVRLGALPFAGPWLAGAIGTGVDHSHVGGGIGWWAAVVGAVVSAAALIALAAARRRDAAIWLIVPGLALAAVSFGGGMLASDASLWFNVDTAERYDFLPLVLMTLGLIVLAERGTRRIGRVCRGLVALTLIWGVAAFPFPIRPVSRGPHWSDEVAAWRRDHRHRLATWPAQWTVDLSDRDRPCPPLSAGGGGGADPSYCESAWLWRVADEARARAPRGGD